MRYSFVFMKEHKDILICMAVIVLFLFAPKVAAVMSMIVAGGFLLIIGVLILAMLGDLIRGDKAAKQLAQFKKSSEGKCFLWYSSNKRLKTVIDQDLRPLLGPEVEIVYNNREHVETRLSEPEWRYLLAHTNTIKFPRLIAIKNGQVLAISFHKEVHALRFLEMEKEEYKKNVLLKLEKLKND